MVMTKEQIQAVNDLPSEDVEVPEWGGSVRLRTMTGEERDAFEAEVYDVKGEEVIVKRDNYMAKLLCRCLVDDSGNRIFNDKEVKELGKKSAKALKRLFAVAQDLNGLSREVQEELEKK